MGVFVKSIRRIKLEKSVPVYDATVPEYHNFALGNGVYVHNTGKNARDSKYQELMKLDGKIMNVAKQKLHKILESDKVQNILMATGYNFDIHKADVGKEAKGDAYSKLRVGKIFLLPDADEDGRHICVLLLTLYWRLMPRLFEQGMIYVVDAPLYSAFFKNKRYFGDTFLEVKKQLPKGANSNIIGRAKGWGEISPQMLEHVAFNPATRTVIKVTPPKGKELQYFERLVGSETIARKELLGL
jgi:DNA gyrase subunit B